MNTEYVAKHVKALVGFALLISEVQGSRKLSKNQDEVQPPEYCKKLE